MTDAPFFDLLAMSEFTAIEKGTRRCAYARAKSFQSRPTLCDRLLCPWDSPGKNTGVGCHALFHGIFPTQGLNPHLLRLLHCRQFL